MTNGFLRFFGDPSQVQQLIFPSRKFRSWPPGGAHDELQKAPRVGSNPRATSTVASERVADTTAPRPRLRVLGVSPRGVSSHPCATRIETTGHSGTRSGRHNILLNAQWKTQHAPHCGTHSGRHNTQWNAQWKTQHTAEHTVETKHIVRQTGEYMKHSGTQVAACLARMKVCKVSLRCNTFI